MQFSQFTHQKQRMQTLPMYHGTLPTYYTDFFFDEFWYLDKKHLSFKASAAYFNM